MTTTTKRRNPWLWLTAPLAVLVGIAAGVGFFVPDFYHRDVAYFAVQGVAQDLVTLVVGVPALVISAFVAARGSRQGMLVWLGVMIYLVYSYLMYALSVQFNALFLVYVAILGCALYALVGTLSTLDRAAIMHGLLSRQRSQRVVKIIGAFLLLTAAMFYYLWLSETVPALLSGGVPQSVTANGLPTNPVHVLDMAILLPGLILTTLLLWRQRPLGYVLAGAYMTFAILLGVALVAMVIFIGRAGMPVQLEAAAVFGIMVALNGGMLVYYLWGLDEARL
jgi:hypothetical protein